MLFQIHPSMNHLKQQIQNTPLPGINLSPDKLELMTFLTNSPGGIFMYGKFPPAPWIFCMALWQLPGGFEHVKLYGEPNLSLHLG